MTVHWSHHADAVPAASEKYSPSTSPADQFVAIVCGGDLPLLVKFVVSFQFAPRQLAEIVAVAARRINRQEVWLPNVAITTESHVGKAVERAVLAFRADSVHRILVISTDPDLKPLVAGSPKDSPSKLPAILSDDPSLLFRQIARLFSLPQAPSPPPLSAGSLPPAIPVAGAARPAVPHAPAAVNVDASPAFAAQEKQRANFGSGDSFAVAPQRSHFMAWNVLVGQIPGDSET
jgi:hypothetical protein